MALGISQLWPLTPAFLPLVPSLANLQRVSSLLDQIGGKHLHGVISSSELSPSCPQRTRSLTISCLHPDHPQISTMLASHPRFSPGRVRQVLSPRPPGRELQSPWGRRDLVTRPSTGKGGSASS